MREIELQTLDGRLVVTAKIPPFQSLPDAVLWGNRSFKLHDRDSADLPIYRECFLYVIPPGENK